MVLECGGLLGVIKAVIHDKCLRHLFQLSTAARYIIFPLRLNFPSTVSSFRANIYQNDLIIYQKWAIDIEEPKTLQGMYDKINV